MDAHLDYACSTILLNESSLTNLKKRICMYLLLFVCLNLFNASGRRVQPWQPVYQLELSAALEMGQEAHQKLTQPLEHTPSSSVVFEDGSSARILSNSLVRRVFDLASLSFRSASSKIGFATAYGGARIVYRGYDAAASALSPAPSPPTAPSTGLPAPMNDMMLSPKEEERQVKQADESEARGRSGSIQQGSLMKSKTPVGNDATDDVTDLIFIIHGIGQGVGSICFTLAAIRF